MLHVVLFLAGAQPDSLTALRTAREAQESFESRRRILAPRAPGRGAAECDEKIGRFCYWYGDVDPLPREPGTIASARNWLLTVLDSAAAQVPGDWWIAGQRVRYLVEGGRLPEAVAVARACRSERWWCAALEGFALHAAEDDAAADSAYGVALDAMPVAQRCRWTDLTPLLQGPLRQRFARLGCDARAAFSAHLWWLAQPLFSRAGNDRRVEHFARLTMVRMLERAGSAWVSPLADDLREMTLRYGWPVAWTAELGDRFDSGRDISGHERQPAFHFFPDAEPARDRATAPWTLLPPRPRERYAPLYAKGFENLAVDVTVFHRADSTFAVASYDLTRDTMWRQQSGVRGAVVLARDENIAPVVVPVDDVTRRGVVVAAAPWRATVVGFEVAQAGTHRAGRMRLALPDRDAADVGVSDLLVFDPVDTLPQDLFDVLPLVHGPARISSERFGLYWELYGLAAGEPIEATVNVTRLGGGLLRRIGASLGLGKRSRETSLAWRDHSSLDGGVLHRAVVIDVSNLEPGRYRIALTVVARSRTVTTARELEIVRPR